MAGLYDLQAGGYPFRPNDLDIEVWRDMGTLKHHLEEQRTMRLMQIPRVR